MIRTLTIAMVSLTTRRAKFRERMLGVLQPQLDRYRDRINFDLVLDEGEATIGEKRNVALKRASGDFFCFVDDDDLVPPYYCEKILAALDDSPDVDCVGFTSVMTYTDGRRFTSRHTLQSRGWWFDRSCNLYHRTPQHLNPMRTEKAQSVDYPSINLREDEYYSLVLYRSGVLQHEYMIESPPMYYYFPHLMWEHKPIQGWPSVIGNVSV